MRRQIILVVVCVALAVTLFLLGFSETASVQTDNDESYALIIDDDTGSFVMQLRKGMLQAALEHNARMTVYSIAEAEKAEGLTAIIVWLPNPAYALERLDGVPAVVVGQSCEGAVCVQGDDRSAGGQLMLNALEDCDAKQVVLVCDESDEHSIRRCEGARAEAEGLPITELVYSDGLKLPDGCAAAVATSRESTRALIAMKRDGLFKGIVLGVDTGDERVSDLEDGLADALALDSPYAMGYLALTRARTLAAEGRAEDTVTKVLIATGDNMYNIENVKQVFPLLH